MFDACSPLGPVITSKETRWFSAKLLNADSWMAEKCAKMSCPPPSGVMNPNPLLSLNHFTVPVAPLSVLGLVTVDLQSVSDPSQVQVTSPPTFVHVHEAITGSAVISAGDDDTGVDGAGAALEASGAEAAVDAVSGVEEAQPERRSAPAAAMATATVVTILGACMAVNLSLSLRCTRSDNSEYRCPKADEQITS